MNDFFIHELMSFSFFQHMMGDYSRTSSFLKQQSQVERVCGKALQEQVEMAHTFV
jgi:hypothetical protein